MVTWEQAQQLQVGQTVWEEHGHGNLVWCQPIEVMAVEPERILFGSDSYLTSVPKRCFPLNDLYLENPYA